MKALWAQTMLCYITYFINTSPGLRKRLEQKICFSLEILHFHIKVSPVIHQRGGAGSDECFIFSIYEPEDPGRLTAGREAAAHTEGAG